MELESALAECVGSLVPGIEFEVIPVGGRVASR
jgi:hypothetical protein